MGRFLTAILVAALCLIAGCGVYTFNPKGKSSISSVAVERFANKTAQYGIEDQMTDQVIDALIADGTLKVVAREYAEAVLTGVLARYERRVHDYDENDQVKTYAVEMYFDIELIKPGDETEIWKESVGHTGIYDAASETEEDGQQKAITLLVEAILNKTTKSW
jgi:outer membrane lipopolysaccharide assembly protein LptE/RlpB